MPEYNSIPDSDGRPERVLEEVTVKERGFFQGYAVCDHEKDRYQYRYNKYGTFTAAAHSMIGMLQHANLDTIQLQEAAEKLPKVEWDPEKDEREMFELSDGTLVFMSNHIPNDTDGVTFTQVGDHTNCTEDQCFGDDYVDTDE